MKRRIAKLIVFVLAGAIVNVAVAWGCAALVPAYWRQYPEPDLDIELTSEAALAGWQARAPHDWLALPNLGSTDGRLIGYALYADLHLTREDLDGTICSTNEPKRILRVDETHV